MRFTTNIFTSYLQREVRKNYNNPKQIQEIHVHVFYAQFLNDSQALYYLQNVNKPFIMCTSWIYSGPFYRNLVNREKKLIRMFFLKNLF